MRYPYVLALAVVVALVSAVLTSRAVAGPNCFEDEVIVWTGTAHTACVPMDDL